MPPESAPTKPHWFKSPFQVKLTGKMSHKGADIVGFIVGLGFVILCCAAVVYVARH